MRAREFPQAVQDRSEEVARSRSNPRMCREHTAVTRRHLAESYLDGWREATEKVHELMRMATTVEALRRLVDAEVGKVGVE